MKYKLLTIACLFSGLTANAQLINQGGSITIQPGATMIVESDVINNNTGTITNNGTVEIEGKFENNSGTLNSGSSSELKFIGSGNVTIKAGTHSIHKMTLAKEDGGTVTVLDDLTVNDDLKFDNDNNQLVLDDGGDLTLIKTAQLESNATSMGADDNNFIATTGSKSVRAMVAGTALTFPVGKNITSYNPVTITENGTSDQKAVRVTETAYEDGPTGSMAYTSDVVNQTYTIAESVAGGSNMDITLQWNTADQLAGFDPADCAVAKFDGTAYLVDESELGAATMNTRSTSAVTPGSFIVGGEKIVDYVAVAPKVILDGAYDGTTMRDVLRSQSSFPTADPYPIAPYNYTHAGRGAKSSDITAAQLDLAGDNAIVDWVYLELRDKTDNTNILHTKSVFLQKDGDVVEPDGSSVKIRGAADDDYYLVVKHRNHLGIMSASTVALTKTPAIVDFTNPSTTTYGTHAQRVISGKTAMWAGDANGDGKVYDNATPSDDNSVAHAVITHIGNIGVFGSGPVPIFGGYINAYTGNDCNLDGNVYDNATPSDGNIVANRVIIHPGNIGVFGSGPVPIFGGMLAQLP